MTDGVDKPAVLKPSTMDIYAGIQGLSIQMTERFTRLETTYGFVNDRLGKIEEKLEKTTSELEHDISTKTTDMESRMRAVEKQVWELASAAGVIAIVVTMVIDRVVIPAVAK